MYDIIREEVIDCDYLEPMAEKTNCYLPQDNNDNNSGFLINRIQVALPNRNYSFIGRLSTLNRFHRRMIMNARLNSTTNAPDDPIDDPIFNPIDD